jgi:two-component system response regulator (stage 0 sporulation protein F)
MGKLLIVDDELDVREFARSFFRKRGFDVFIASAGREAMDLIDKENPDLILLDIRMGEMSGIDVLRELRQRNNPVKVVMVSGIEEDAVVQETTLLGALGFIHKPLILEELEKIVLREFAVPQPI